MYLFLEQANYMYNSVLKEESSSWVQVFSLFKGYQDENNAIKE